MYAVRAMAHAIKTIALESTISPAALVFVPMAIFVDAIVLLCATVSTTATRTTVRELTRPVELLEFVRGAISPAVNARQCVAIHNFLVPTMAARARVDFAQPEILMDAPAEDRVSQAVEALASPTCILILSQIRGDIR